MGVVDEGCMRTRTRTGLTYQGGGELTVVSVAVVMLFSCGGRQADRRRAEMR